MGLFDFLKRKSSRTYGTVIAQGLKQAVWTPKDYSALAKAGYEQCMAVYACVSLIARTAAGLMWKLERTPRDKRGKVETIEPPHPLLQLLDRPNERTSGYRFWENAIGFFLLAGNNYITKAAPDTGPNRGRPQELHLLFPDLVRIKPGDKLDPIAYYEYRIRQYEPDTYAPEDVCHTKFFHPTDQWYGLSPLEVASRGIDTVNMATEWNYRLLQNDGRLPGAWILKEGDLNVEEKEALEKELDEKFMGYKSVGRAPLLQGDLDWKDYGITPRDMEHLNTEKYNSRKICAIFNIAPELVGDSENKTYSNYQEARKALYVETVLPLMRIFRDELNYWLVPLFGERLKLDIDRDAIEPLKEDRKVLYEYVSRADWLTDNEKRELTGHEEVPGGDVIYKPINLIPVGTTPTSGSKSVPLITLKSLEGRSFWAAPERKRLLWDSFVQRIEAKERPLKTLAEEYLTAQADAVKRKAAKLTTLSGILAEALMDVEVENGRYVKMMLPWYVETLEKAGEAGMVISKGQLYDFEKKDDLNYFKLTPELEKRLKALVVESAAWINEFTRELIRDVLKLAEASNWTVQELATELDQKLSSFTPGRARRVARTETAMVENWGLEEGYKQSEFVESRGWLSAFVDTTRETHKAADAQYSSNPLPLGDPFSVGGYDLMFPGDRSLGAPAGETINCLCTTYPHVGGLGE